MPYHITPDCTACGECLPVCPIDAIAIGDPIYVIDPALCVDFEECLPVCPVNAIVPTAAASLASPAVAAAAVTAPAGNTNGARRFDS